MKKLLQITVCVSAVLLLTNGLYSQSILYGKILDNKQNEGLLGASVIIKSSNEGTITDFDGNFELSHYASFPLIIEVSYVGYQTVILEITENEKLEIFLTEGIIIGQEIVISASRKTEKISEAPASITVVDSRKITSQALSHPSLALRNMEGVEINQQGVDHFQISLRGRSDPFSTETYFLKDYRSLITPGQGTFTVSRTSLNELDIDRIEVVRGPGSALYGPGVETGVVHFITKSPIDYPGTSVSIGGGTQSSMLFAGRHAGKINDRLGYKLTAHYRRADDFLLDPIDSLDAESLSQFQPMVTSALTGEVIRTTNELIEEVSNYSVAGALEYRADKFKLNATAGYNYRKGVTRANLGEALQDYPSYFGQVRLEAGSLFAQIYLNRSKDDNEKNVLYRTGLTSISDNTGLQGQVQYDWTDLADQLDISIGGEIQRIFTNTEGTVHGRYEEVDQFNIYSVYTQAKWTMSPQIDFIAATRMDRFTAIDETTISPRAGLIYKISPTHSFRLTFNRAITPPSSLFIYADIPFGVSPAFDIPFIGGLEPLTFADEISTNSFLPGVGSYPGTDLPLAIPYGVAVAGLEGVFSDPVLDYLLSRLSEVTGTTDGIMLLNGNPISVLPERGKIQSTKTSAFEIGYKGVFSNKISAGVSLFYNRRNDLIFIGPVSPLVVNPSLSSDLVNELIAVTDADELLALGVSQSDIADAFAAIGNELAANPLGLVQPDITFDSDRPQFVVTPSNTGVVNYFGAEFNFNYFFSDDLSLFANYAWLEKNLFNAAELDLEGTGQEYALNIPKHRIRIGIDNIPSNKGISYSVSLRYQNQMEVRSGTIFSGTLDSYTLVDAGIGYNLGNGIRFNMTVQNLFDKEYRTMPRMPKIERMMLIKGMYEF